MNFMNNVLGRYWNHPEAVVISCFFNPMNSPYRNKALDIFYKSIKHLNHRIVECVIGDSEPHLPETKNISRVYTESLLWHKETLLNNIIKNLPEQFRYVFWVDADVIFTNPKWLYDGVQKLHENEMIQPFEYCIHLEKDRTEPTFDVEEWRSLVECGAVDTIRRRKMWRSFCANFVDGERSIEYDVHGHVGFAWGARRTVLEACPLYEKALIGGADHIIAHAAADQVPHPCIVKAFKDNLADVEQWSHTFAHHVGGELGFVEGDLHHIWHGDIEKREYLKRIKDFTRNIKNIHIKDSNGLYISRNFGDQQYLKRYFMNREVLGYGYQNAFNAMLDVADAALDVVTIAANSSMSFDDSADNPQDVSPDGSQVAPSQTDCQTDCNCDCGTNQENNNSPSENFS
jgi:hypothetical protein